MSVERLPCGCVVYVRDGGRTLASTKDELCAEAWETGQRMADAFFAADDVTEEVRETDRWLSRHAGGEGA